MARGRPAKNPEQRARRNGTPKPPAAPGAIRVRGPKLPATCNGAKWHPETVKWWDAMRRSPLVENFTPIEWAYLLDTALMHHAMWSKEQWTLAAEVRLRTTEIRRMAVALKVASPAKPEATKKATTSKQRYGALRIVGTTEQSAVGE